VRRTGLIAVAVCALAGLALAVWLLLPPRSTGPKQGKAEVRVAAAADLQFALEDVVKAFGERRPDIDVKVTYGSSGNFYAQLSNRAPFDLYLSADVDYPRKLVAQGLADERSEFLYAVGHLVLWVPDSSPLPVEKAGAQALLDPSVKKVAIANPRHAPYGRAAEAALKSLGVYEQVRDKLVLGENVAQAAQFVQSGAADVGLIALSLALAPALRGRGRYWEVPLDAHPRLEQGGVILSWAQDREAAEALRSFLLGDEGRAVLKRYGFFLPGG
jgi:molybdate transport system substrate-binding protein